MAMAQVVVLQAKYSPLTQPAVHYLPLKPQSQSSNSFRSIRIGICFSHFTIQAQLGTTRTKRKVKPSFFEQIRHKWSHKVISPREKFPWQEQEEEEEVVKNEPETDVESRVRSEPSSSALPNRFVSAPWIHGTDSKETKFDSPQTKITTKKEDIGDDGLLGSFEKTVVHSAVKEKTVIELDKEGDYNKELKTAEVKIDANPVELSKDRHREVGSLNQKQIKGYQEVGDPSVLPWKRNTDRRKRSNTELAEKMIPEHELQRLRNISLRMLERTKVGSAGITQALVDSIHEKWKLDGVVKLKFEEPHSLQMKRTHEILEVSVYNFLFFLSF